MSRDLRRRFAALTAPVLFVGLAACGQGDGSSAANAQPSVTERPHNVRVLEVRPSDLVETY